MADTYCERTDLLVSACAHCRGVPDIAPRPGVLGPLFEARFGGGCSECGGGIRAGDRIRADGDGGYLCAGCSDG